MSEPEWYRRWENLVSRLVIFASEDRRDEMLRELSVPERPRILAFVNAHAMNLAATSADFFRALGQADTLLRDGTGVAALLRMLNRDPGLNLNGTDLIPELLSRFSGRHVALFGTVEPFLGSAGRKISGSIAEGCQITLRNGFLEPEAYLSAANECRPDVIVLAMGMPKQEKVALMLRSGLSHSCMIVCGGAILDFLGGRKSRAPKVVRWLGTEWAFRLIQEPRRLFYRYVIGNPVFLLRAIRFTRWVRRQGSAAGG